MCVGRTECALVSSPRGFPRPTACVQASGDFVHQREEKETAVTLSAASVLRERSRRVLIAQDSLRLRSQKALTALRLTNVYLNDEVAMKMRPSSQLRLSWRTPLSRLPHLRRGSFFNRRRIRRQDPMQETATGAYKHFRGVCEPIGLEECQHLRVQQRVASVETVVTAVFTRKLDTAQHDFGFFFHGCDSLRR